MADSLDPGFEQLARYYQQAWENGFENPYARIDDEHLIAWQLPFGALDSYHPDREAAAQGLPFMGLHQGFAPENNYRAMVIHREGADVHGGDRGRNLFVLRYMANGPNSYMAVLAEAPYVLWPLDATAYARTHSLFLSCLGAHQTEAERLATKSLQLPGDDGEMIHPWPVHVQVLADVNGRLRTQVFHTSTSWIPDGRYYALDDEDRLHDIDWLVNDKDARRRPLTD